MHAYDAGASDQAPTYPLRSDAIKRLADSGIAYTPTLIVGTKHVMKNGRLYDATNMDEVYPRQQYSVQAQCSLNDLWVIRTAQIA